jgi:hypothetical protein
MTCPPAVLPIAASVRTTFAIDERSRLKSSVLPSGWVMSRARFSMSRDTYHDLTRPMSSPWAESDIQRLDGNPTNCQPTVGDEA